EPTGNLDPHTAEEVHEIFHKLNRELGITLVIATHNERLMRSVGRALTLHEGKLLAEPKPGTGRERKGREEVRLNVSINPDCGLSQREPADPRFTWRDRLASLVAVWFPSVFE